MDTWMDGGMDGHIDVWFNGRIDRLLDTKMDGVVVGWTH